VSIKYLPTELIYIWPDLCIKICIILYMLGTGEKERKFMKKKIHYSNEPIGEIKIIKDFLPSPEKLVIKCR
jgi:hypothetical protein